MNRSLLCALALMLGVPVLVLAQGEETTDAEIAKLNLELERATLKLERELERLGKPEPKSPEAHRRSVEKFLKTCPHRRFLSVGSINVIFDGKIALEQPHHPTVKKLIAEGFTVMIGDSSTAVADLWCAPADYSNVLERLERFKKGKDPWLFRVHEGAPYSFEDWMRGKPIEPNKAREAKR